MNIKDLHKNNSKLLVKEENTTKHKNSKNTFRCEEASLEPYLCPHCNFETHSKENLKLHSKTSHQNEEPEVNLEDTFLQSYQCKNCNFQTFSTITMLKHVTNYCYQPIKTKKDPNRDKELQKKQYNDEIRGFFSTATKWRQCQLCPHVSLWKTDYVLHLYMNHMEESHDPKWLHCAQCSKLPFREGLYPFRGKRRYTYGASSGVKHKRVKCSHCGFKSRHYPELKRHLWSKHREKKKRMMRCDRCSFKHKFLFSFLVHVYRRHWDGDGEKRDDSDYDT